MEELTLDKAMALVDAAREKASANGTALNIAVVDSGDNLLAFARMDGAFLGSKDVALGKAHTAVAFKMTTRDLTDLVQPGQPLYGIQFASNGIVAIAGGAPLKNSTGDVVGAIGVSGGPVDQDGDLAESVAASY